MGLERKVEVLSSCTCLLSLNAMCLSVAVDACRVAKCFAGLLTQWKSCLPLGDACDVDFTAWGMKMWEWIRSVQHVYGQHHVQVNQYEYSTEMYQRFKEQQDEVEPTGDSMAPLQGVNGRDVAGIVTCGLRELNEVLMAISEFLNSLTEEQIVQSFAQWRDCYRKHYHATCRKDYDKWKISFSKRTLRKNLQERIQRETETLRKMFESDAEWDMVYDTEQKKVDEDGLSRFLFTNARRYGVSRIGDLPLFSAALRELFVRLDLLQLMQADMQPQKKAEQKKVAMEDELEKKVRKLVEKVHDLAAEEWKERLTGIWQHIFSNFRYDIAKAGPHEKFKEFSKKTIYCIIGHLKMKGVYQPVTNVEMTKVLEGENNGMRKYLNNGLSELSPELKKRIQAFVEKEMQALAA